MLLAHDVFVSYSSGDKPIADAVVATLERAEIRCWVAPRDVMPGDKWADAIVRAIDGGRLMVLVFTSDANTSQHIVREVELAAQHGIVVIPLRVEDVRPCPTLDYYIAGTHWLDAVDPPLEAHLERLTQVIGRLLEAPRAEASTPVDSGPQLKGPVPPSASSGRRAAAAQVTTGVLSPPAKQMPGRAEPEVEVIPEMPGRAEPEVEVIPEMPGRAEPEVEVIPGTTSTRRPVLIGGIVGVVLLLVAVLAIVLLRAGGEEGGTVARPASPSAPAVLPTVEATVPAPTPSAPSSPVERSAPRVGAPTDVRVAQITPYQVKLIWRRAPEGGKVDHFRVYRDGDSVNGKLDERSFVDGNIRPGRTYRYRVVAIGVNGSRASSPALIVNVPSVPSSPTGSPPASSGNLPPACDGILTPSGECIPWS